MTTDEKAKSKRRPPISLAARLAGLVLDFTPGVFAVLAFAAGAVMLAASATPEIGARLEPVARYAPVLVIELSHFLASVVGFLLMVIASGLWRRQRGAFWIALALLAGGAVFSVLRHAPVIEPALLVGVAAAMLPCRRAFRRRSRLTAGAISPVWLGAIVVTVGAAAWLGFFAYRDIPYTDELWWTFLRDADVARFLRAEAALALLTLLLGLSVLFSRPSARGRGRASPEDIERAAAILETAQDAPTNAALALVGDKDLLFSASGRSFLMFRVRGAHFVALESPAGDPAERRDLLWAFLELADREGRGAVMYGVGDELLPDLASLGMSIRKVGESATVDLSTFSLTGRARQDLRTARNRAEREGYRFELLPPGSAAAHEAELSRISNAWLAAQKGGEKGFSMGRFDLAYLNRTPLAVVRGPDGAVAFANLLVNRARSEVGVDLMRHLEVRSFVMDYLFAEAILWAQREGYRTFDLGKTPLAGLDDHDLAPLFIRLGDLVFDEGGALYSFQGLRAYKTKFSPSWRPVYIAATPGVPMVSALLDVALLSSGGWRGVLGLRGRPKG
ncbi:phosphatidylglycerol lysyltransferase domain-containing protein [Phenylobacterium terrae]|uniref:Phosphatidylglycerol lysyltransferase domain-containing protein n=1 Tax=Phenylobacterium terrae TaxID=2665495 RepID=A0ABW4N1X3_9CAUL